MALSDLASCSMERQADGMHRVTLIFKNLPRDDKHVGDTAISSSAEYLSEPTIHNLSQGYLFVLVVTPGCARRLAEEMIFTQR